MFLHKQLKYSKVYLPLVFVFINISCCLLNCPDTMPHNPMKHKTKTSVAGWRSGAASGALNSDAYSIFVSLPISLCLDLKADTADFCCSHEC